MVMVRTRKIRVMPVDDSSIVRRMVKAVLERSVDCEVVYSAVNGKDAVENIKATRPEVMIIDVQMPVMDGIETVRAARAIDPNIRFLMFSSLTASGTKATLAALEAGAHDFLEKPQNATSTDVVFEELRTKMVPKVVALGRTEKRVVAPVRRVSQSLRNKQPVPEIIGIGASTGGPRALAQLLNCLDEDFCIPILIVQHMPPVFTQLFAEQLDRNSSMKVREAAPNELIQPGQVWVARGNRHLKVLKEGLAPRLQLSVAPGGTISRPSVDVFFQSLAESYGARCLSIVMTGMGKDGLIGARQIVEKGGTVLAQDEASSSVWGMPRAVYEAGLTDDPQSIEEIAAVLNQASALRRSRQTEEVSK